MSTILVVDDQLKPRRLLIDELEDAGFEVSEASDGEEAWERFRLAPPDLVITDMMMPRMGGFPILEYLKKLDDAPRIIMITANEGGRHKAYAEMLGIDDYLRKPFAMDVLIDAVGGVIGAADDEKPAPASAKRTTAKKKP